jgi:WD40 repeat protein
VGKIVTFYSYKGGTGRSMALGNVAWVLASNGAKVLAVDWDLEAPGLHRYFRPFLSDRELTRFESQGVIDFMVDFVERLSTRPAETSERGAEWFKEHADLSKWGKRLLWPSGEDAETPAGGFIDFVPAGRQGAQYAKRVNSFDWAGFYERYKGGAFMDAVRASMKKYDWVLIDSRTGVSDTAGICTTQLPDILVVCFTLNYQSIDGSVAVAESAKQSRKDLLILPVPTRLDGNEEKLLKAMMGYAQRQFRPLLEPSIAQAEYWREMGVPYFSRYAYCEKLAPFEEQVNVSTSTLPAMETLTRYITGQRISRLGPLPKEHRAAALADFEEMPDEADSRVPEPVKRSTGFLRRLLTRSLYVWKARPITNSVFAGLVVLAGLYAARSWQKSPTPQDLVERLAEDAGKDLRAGRRDHGALLLAEAAGRLDPAVIIEARSEPGRQIYEALMDLKVFRLGLAQAGTDVVQISPDGKFVASTGPQKVTQLCRFPPTGHPGGLNVGYSAVAFSPDSRFLATGGRNGSVSVWDTASQNRVWQWDNPDPNSAWVTALAFSPNGNLLGAGTDTGEIMIAKVDPWSVLMPNGAAHLVQPGGVLSLAFSLDSIYLATGGADSVAHFWTYKQTKPVESLAPLKGPVYSIVFVPTNNRTDPRRLATASGTSGSGAVTLWTQTAGVPNRSELWSDATALRDEPYSVAFSPNGESVVIGRTGSPTLAGPFNRGVTQSGFGADVRTVSFSADGKRLLTGNGLGLVQLWDVAKGAELQRISVAHAVKSVALSHDGKYFAIASDDGVFGAFVHVGTNDSTPFSALEVRGLACSQTADSQLKADEWKHYFGSEPLRYTCGGSATILVPRAIARPIRPRPAPPSVSWVRMPRIF